MNKEEIKEFLKRVEELEEKLEGEDFETLQWLIFGYNQCARLLNETEQENQQLKEKYLNVVADYEYEHYKNQKAIGYIENDLQSFLYSVEYKTLLEMLKGEKNNG